MLSVSFFPKKIIQRTVQILPVSVLVKAQSGNAATGLDPILFPPLFLFLFFFSSFFPLSLSKKEPGARFTCPSTDREGKKGKKKALQIAGLRADSHIHSSLAS